MAGLSFAQGALGAYGQAQRTRAANRAAIQNYKYQVEVRKRRWHQALTVYGAKRIKYAQDLNENDMAAARGYAQAQAGLNTAYEVAIQNNETAFIKYMQEHGQLSAAGRTGRSIDRINSRDIASLERTAGREAWKLTKTEEAFRENVAAIRRAQRSQRNQLYQNVAYQPVPDVAPPRPILQNPNSQLIMGLLGAGLGAVNVYNKYKIPKTGNPQLENQPGGGVFDTPSPYNPPDQGEVVPLFNPSRWLGAPITQMYPNLYGLGTRDFAQRLNTGGGATPFAQQFASWNYS